MSCALSVSTYRHLLMWFIFHIVFMYIKCPTMSSNGLYRLNLPTVFVSYCRGLAEHAYPVMYPIVAPILIWMSCTTTRYVVLIAVFYDHAASRKLSVGERPTFYEFILTISCPYLSTKKSLQGTCATSHVSMFEGKPELELQELEKFLETSK